MAEAPRPSADLVKGGKVMIVKVEACSISRGDSMMLQGAIDLVRFLCCFCGGGRVDGGFAAKRLPRLVSISPDIPTLNPPVP